AQARRSSTHLPCIRHPPLPERGAEVSSCPRKPRPHRPDRHPQGGRDLRIREVLPRVQQHHITLTGIQAGERIRESSSVLTVAAPSLRKAWADPRERLHRALFSSALVTKQVGGDPEQPRPGCRRIAAKAAPSLKRNRERRCCQVVG